MKGIDDNLPVSEVGEWTLEKHERLRRYVDITRGVRKKWLTPMRLGVLAPGATYIDLFCGPGRSQIRDTGRVIDGSPVVAASAAAEGGAPFSKILLADLDPSWYRLQVPGSLPAVWLRVALWSCKRDGQRDRKTSIPTDCISPSSILISACARASRSPLRRRDARFQRHVWRKAAQDVDEDRAGVIGMPASAPIPTRTERAGTTISPPLRSRRRLDRSADASPSHVR